jgi:hypothetical protein
VPEPTVTELGRVSEVEVESGATERLTWPEEPFRIEPAGGVKVALIWTAEAANDVEQATVALWPLGVTGRPTQPPTGVPPSAKVTVPPRSVLLVAELTVAISATVWFVIGAVGEARTAVVVGCEAGGVGEATTTAVLLLVADVLPPAFRAVTTQAILLPTSAADSV